MAEELLTDAERDALALLAQNQRLLITIVPKDIPDRFMARLTAWQNFVLDTKLLPPLFLPAERSRTGDGLVCPYCGAPASQKLDMHAKDCEWAEAAIRWGGAQLQIDEEFPVAD
jgi:hypothetical protein